MKKNILFSIFSSLFCALIITGCSKSDNVDNNNTPFATLQAQTLTDFVNVLVKPAYADFKAKASILNDRVKALAANTTAANQQAAQEAWRNVRVIWEQSEGFLVGPVDFDEYDPNMDTWPTDRNTMESLLAGSQPLTVDFLESENSDAQRALKGFHPLEYLLWDKDPANYTAREIDYLQALAQDILNNVTKLNDSWNAGNYGKEFIEAGTSSSRYVSQKEAILEIANALIGICDEVGGGKMVDPFGVTASEADSTLTESPYSHNSVNDFKNNITGAFNVYKCVYGNTSGTSISSLVAAKNKALDNKIKALFTTAINSFDGFDNLTFEYAIYKQRSTVSNTIQKIDGLKETLEDELLPFIQQYVKN